MRSARVMGMSATGPICAAGTPLTVINIRSPALARRTISLT